MTVTGEVGAARGGRSRLALPAAAACGGCGGTGLVGEPLPHACGCALRGAHDACLEQFRQVADSPLPLGLEYRCDFVWAARRALGGGAEAQLWRWWALQGASVSLLARRLQVPSAQLEPQLQQLAERVGRELLASSLWPTSAYFLPAA